MKTSLKIIVTLLLLNFADICKAQNSNNTLSDTLPSKILDSVIINSWLRASDASYMADVEAQKFTQEKNKHRRTF